VVNAGDLRAALGASRLLAIARGGEPARAVAVLDALADEGIRVAEVSLSDPRGLPALAAASRTLGPQVLLGAGTVLTAEQVARAADAGAQFIVTPAWVAEVAEACSEARLALVPGTFTPTEVAAAAPSAAAVKIFPAEPAGPAHVAALRGPFPDVPLVAVGGIGPEEARGHLRAGALAVGVGSPLMGDALERGDLGELRGRARALLAAVAPA
jgi:2-dehydro-3-deoxyphosphogluconate aldolase / (4S)-4-hydroxy-2-oxoglutarate aldolase